MNRRFSSLIGFSFAVIASWIAPVASTNADVFNIDLSAVDPSAIPAVLEAEAIWEARIQAYSTELPRAIRDQLGSLYISATVAPVDGPGGTLAFAGPDAVISTGNNTRNYAVAVRASMTFDLDDFDFLADNDILVSTIAHEMGHAMGFGTLFEGNDLIGARGGFGQIEYINGRYAIQGYQRDLGNPVVSFVPLEQRGGAGTALGHWNDVPPFFNQVFTGAFTKELMTGFAGDANPNTGALVFAPNFVAEATFGAMADLGYSVDGFNGAFAAPKGSGTGRWPKIVGSGTNPFDSNGVPAAAGLQFNIVTIKAVYNHSLGSQGSGVGDVATDAVEDPYNLRQHRWVK